MPNTGYLFINLGTPDSPTTADVRRYLNEFLMDPYVISLPWPLRRLLVSAFILPFRPKRSAEAYASIWQPEGSPLLHHSQQLVDAVGAKLQAPVALGMRYGTPSIASALNGLRQQGVTQLTVMPLYPHYADSTVTTSLQQVSSLWPQAHTVVPAFYQEPDYIESLAQVTRAHLDDGWDHLLMSYHGLPEQHLTRADPTQSHCLQEADCCQMPSTAHATCYRHQVYATSQALAQALSLEPSQYTVSFQSRLGRQQWLTPYTDQVLNELPQRGVKHLAVVCPAFVADNLETLEEIGMQGRETFIAAGGETFQLVPCLNAEAIWIDALVKLLAGQNSAASADTSA